MKIDIDSLRPCNAEILPRCIQLIEHIKSAPDEESFFTRLVDVHEWQPQFGKSEMARWADVLNMCDEVLERAVKHVDTRGVLMWVDAEPVMVRRVAAVLSFTALLFENTFTRSIYSSADSEMARWADVLNMCDEVLERAVKHVDTRGVLMWVDAEPVMVRRVAAVLSFTALLFENTFTRSIYSSADRLVSLLDSGNMEVVVETLRLLQVISKRSRFLSQHLSEFQQKQLTMKLTAIVQCWSGKLRNSKMDECCASEVWSTPLLPICYQVGNSTKIIRSVQLDKSLALEVDEVLLGEKVSEEERISLCARMRLVRAFCTVEGRRMCVVARLLALSVLVYSRTLLEEWQLNSMLYDSLVEEISRLLLVDIAPSVYSRTLLEEWQLNSMLYDSLVEEISRLLLVDIAPSGVLVDTIKTEALKTLTSIISLDRPAKQNVVVECLGANSYHGFMARAVRICVEDLRRGTLGMPGHNSVQFCTALFSLLYHLAGFDNGGDALVSCALTESLLAVVGCESVPLEQISFATRAVRVLDIMTSLDANAFTANNGMNVIISRLAVEVKECKKAIECSDESSPVEPCHQQRAALIKSLLNFIKRAVQDSQFAESVRHIMDGALPSALIQIISRCDFFGASLFHNAGRCCLTASYDANCFQLPASRDVLAALPNTFTALCLNERGLHNFIAEDPFEHLCNILVSTKFISAMKRRRNEMNEAAVSLGSALDDLLRHQPTLRPLLLNSFVKMLDRLVEFASCEQPRCVMSLSSSRSMHATVANASNATVAAGSPSQNEEPSANINNDTSDEDDDDPPSAAPNIHVFKMLDRLVEFASCEQPRCVMSLSSSRSMHATVANASNATVAAGSPSQNEEPNEAAVSLGSALDDLLRHQPTLRPLLLNSFVKMLDRLVEFASCEQPRCVMSLSSSRSMHATVANASNATVAAGSPSQNEEPSANINNDTSDEDDDDPPSAAPNMEEMSPISERSYIARDLGLSPEAEVNGEKVVGLGEYLLNVGKLLETLLTQSASSEHAEASMRRGAANRLIALLFVKQISLEVSQSIFPQLVSNILRYLYVTLQCDEMRKTNSLSLEVALAILHVGIAERLVMREDCWLRTKSGVTALGRCQRQLSELMAMLAKVCTSIPPRRRTHEPLAVTPDKNAVSLATHLFAAYKVALEWQPKHCADPAVLLPYLNGWITTISGILFDERRIPYHLLLSAFYHSGCHNMYFSLIVRYISLEVHREHSMEVEQLLQAWLSLTERLVNADAFNHSRHRLAQDCEEAKRFPAQKYLTLAQQDALRQVNAIFALLMSSTKAGNANVAVCELTVSLYRQLIKGLIPSADPSNKTAVSADERNRLIAELDEASINFLVDMGFERDAVIEALFEYATVEEATEFLVANDRQQHALANDSRVDELEDVESAEMGEEKKEAEVGETEAEVKLDEAPPPPLSEVTPLDVNAILESTCTEVVPACMQMMELGVELVFNTSELLLAIVDDMNKEWRVNVLVKQYFVTDVIGMLQKLTANPSDDVLVHSLSTRLHLSCLLWSAIANEYLVECAQCSLQCMLLSLLELTASMQPPPSHTFVKLIAPVCLWLDLYEKMLTMKCNKSKMEKVVESLTWKYWDTDERGGAFTWVNYRPASSHILTRAFYEGNAGANLSIAGKQYAVSFVTMSQRNVDSHVERPITVVARLKENVNTDEFFRPDDSIVEWNEVVRTRMVPVVISLMSVQGLDSNAIHALLILAARITRNAEVAAQMLREGGVQAVVNVAGTPLATRALLVALVVRHCLDDDTSLCQIFEKTIRTDDSIVEWNEVVRTRMVPVVISLMSVQGLDSNAIHALLILAARITRNAEVAAQMLREGGVQAVVNVAGTPLATRALLVALVVRHCLDDDTSLCQIFEKTIRTVAAGGYNLNPSSSRWHHRMPRTTREWLHAMRALAPLCARHPRLFMSTMERVARKQNGQISAVPVPPCESGPKLPPPSAPIRQVVQQLMGHVMDFSWDNNNRVVTRASLIRLIAELVKSYSAVATLVAESQHPSAHSALVTLLDKCIVPASDADSGDSPSSAAELLTSVKSLVISLASCNHSPKAQEALVTDLGIALRVALADLDPKIATVKMLEGFDEENEEPQAETEEDSTETDAEEEENADEEIKALCDMIVLARDVCPAGGHEARATGSAHSQLNPILRLLVKKRICIELAKVPWHLNLSTKEGVDALNHVLKTLDELTRSINSAASGAQAEGAAGVRGSSQDASAALSLNAMQASDVTSTAHARSTADDEHASNADTVRDDNTGQQQQQLQHPLMLEGFDEENEEPQAETEEDSTETDAEEEENADEEMEFEDDEDGANGIDIEDDESDEEEERDDEAMREEGRESDEEDDFGLIEMADESVPIGTGRRFEDGDPDSTFIDANVFLENLDDFDRTGGYEISRPERLSASEVALHPLMHRSSALGTETNALRNGGYRLTISGRRPGTVTAPVLHRQGAVRRWGTVGPQRDILERLIESGTVANAAHLFDVLPSRQRLFNIILHESASEAISAALGEERRHATVPSPLDRFTEAALLIDAHSHFYIWLIAAHHITAHLEAIEKKDKEEKEKSESKKKQETENGAETKETEAKATSEEADAGGASDMPSAGELGLSMEGGAVTVGSGLVASIAAAESAGSDGEEVFGTAVQQDVVEPMDITDSGSVFFDAHEDLEGGSSSGQQGNTVADTSVPSDDTQTTSAPACESNEMIVSTPPHSPQREAEGECEQPSASGAAEEYRDILGDIEVPEGVDPAFLAALPEDIRTEVIRDHQRQQRAQRLAQSAAANAAGAEGVAPGNEAAAASGSSVEPLDQEFLNALPPELQEEILAQHERTLRLATERAQNAAASSSAAGGGAPSTEGDDAVALIESLPPSLRAQVLADADDTVLQVLPQSVAAEARRLRANLEQQVSDSLYFCFLLCVMQVVSFAFFFLCH
ncbi:E3 ubiquitin-protein ligase HUWE1 [Toxocara canis]|uniref:E3 ubiquitin-protein ligase HUWE1 n=1 Tax=Toxocara canis TaxID=6265 RepID=A0A0B2VXD0_TOXCA|nr:E3 ubiquitin-protein ligase HUWE1 [Toxocara canis]